MPIGDPINDPIGRPKIASEAGLANSTTPESSRTIMPSAFFSMRNRTSDWSIVGLVEGPAMLMIHQLKGPAGLANSANSFFEDVRRVLERLAQMHTSAIYREASDFFGVFATTHLQHHQPAMHDFLLLDISQQDDRIGHGRDVLLACAFAAHQRFAGGRTEAGDLPLLDE